MYKNLIKKILTKLNYINILPRYVIIPNEAIKHITLYIISIKDNNLFSSS